MPETYQDRRRTKQPTSSHKLLQKLGRMLLKQIAASLVCLALVLGMHHASSPRLKRYADALGTALRFEADLSVLSQIKEQLLPNNEANLLPESDAPLTEH